MARSSEIKTVSSHNDSTQIYDSNKMDSFIYSLAPKTMMCSQEIGILSPLYKEAAIAILQSWYANWPEVIELGVINNNHLKKIKITIDPHLSLKDFIKNFKTPTLNSEKILSFEMIINHGNNSNLENASYNIMLSMSDTVIICHYNSYLYTKGEIVNYLHNYEKIFIDLVYFPQKKILDSAVVGEEELKKISIFSHCAAVSSEKESIQMLVDQAISRYPNKVALKQASRALTYKELNNIILRINSMLASFNIKKNDRVIVFLPVR